MKSLRMGFGCLTGFRASFRPSEFDWQPPSAAPGRGGGEEVQGRGGEAREGDEGRGAEGRAGRDEAVRHAPKPTAFGRN